MNFTYINLLYYSSTDERMGNVIIKGESELQVSKKFQISSSFVYLLYTLLQFYSLILMEIINVTLTLHFKKCFGIYLYTNNRI